MRGDDVLCEVLGGVRRAKTAYYPSPPRSNLGNQLIGNLSLQDLLTASFQWFDALLRRLYAAAADGVVS
jgi:hypothetical protein